jgi:hypothetical protein
MPDIDQPQSCQAIDVFLAIDVFDHAAPPFDEDPFTLLLSQRAPGGSVEPDVLFTSMAESGNIRAGGDGNERGCSSAHDVYNSFG